MLCQYNGENIFQIEKDLPEDIVREIINVLPKGVDCKLTAREGKRFCIFHDPEAWRTQGSQIAEEFVKLFEEGQRTFIGYHFSEFFLEKKEAVDIELALCKFHSSAYFVGNFERASFAGATFEGGTVFTGVTFKEWAEFSGATFKERAAFNGATFKEAHFTRATFKEVDFEGSTFEGPTDFSGATFEGAAGFGRATFKNWTAFNGATFKNWVGFIGAIFKETGFIGATFKEVDFEGSTFEGRPGFRGAIFEGWAGFRRAIFKEWADFNRTTFKGWTDFVGTTFKQADFNGAMFEWADFNRATFEGRVEFNAAVFKEPTNFSAATFKEWAIFIGAIFKEAIFVGVTFKEADFNRATFEGRSEFSGAIFKEWADFNRAIFKDWADFSGATFKDWAVFNRVTFKEVDFTGTTFEGLTNFRGAAFQGLALFAEIAFPSRTPSTLVVIERVRFERPDGVRFDGTNLSWFLFLGTDIRGIDFRNATWHSRGGRYVLGVDLDLQETLRIEDDGKENKSFFHKTSDDVAQAYRDLRANYELHRRYSEAGDFFIGEKDALRLRPLYEGRLRHLRNLIGRMRESRDESIVGLGKGVLASLLLGLYWILATSRVRFSLLGLYRMLGEYGESVLRPAIWAILVVLGFAILGPSSPVFHLKDQNSLYEVWLMLEPGILRSIYVFFQLEQTITWSCVAERLLGILLLGLTLIAVRRKLERHR